MKKLLLLITLFTLYTHHSNSQWTKQTIPVTKPIVGIEFKDSLKGWAVTSSGSQFDVSYVINTTDGGTNWLLQYTGTGYEFDAFDMVDLNTGYIIGGQFSGGFPRLFKTTNSGQNWIISDPGVGIIFDDIFFPSKDSGFICASNSFAPGLWFTSNGGVSWQVRQNGLIGTAIVTLFFLDNNTGWCGTSTNRLFRTTNTGLNWTQIGMFQNFTLAIYFLNLNTGWIGGGNSGSNGTMWTTNGGLNWNPGVGQGGGYDIIFLNSMTGWAGDVFEKIAKTTDGGITYGYQLDSGGSSNLSIIDSFKGWSGDSRIYRTTNGGGPITYVGIISNYHNIPKSHSLSQNYPNPFNSQTIIRFAINKTSYVKLRVFDILGKEKTLWESDKQLGGGTHELSFDAKELSSGVYFYQLIVSDENGNTRFKDTRKMVLVK